MSKVVLPPWLTSYIEEHPGTVDPQDEKAMMSIAAELSRLNITLGDEADRGGPFGAIIVNQETGEIVGWGVNRVVPNHDPTAHGEMVAIRYACEALGNFTLADYGKFIMVTSGAPCGMCLTGVLWSGCCAIIAGATTRDIEEIVGFDEGIVPDFNECAALLARRGITFSEQVLRHDCCETLRAFVASGSRVYNGQS